MIGHGEPNVSGGYNWSAPHNLYGEQGQIKKSEGIPCPFHPQAVYD